MSVVETLLSVLLIVAIIVLVLGLLGIKYGTLEKKMRLEQQDKLITNYQQQIKDLHKKLREEKEKNKEERNVFSLWICNKICIFKQIFHNVTSM